MSAQILVFLCIFPRKVENSKYNYEFKYQLYHSKNYLKYPCGIGNNETLNTVLINVEIMKIKSSTCWKPLEEDNRSLYRILF